jgi:hypothetical protein
VQHESTIVFLSPSYWSLFFYSFHVFRLDVSLTLCTILLLCASSCLTAFASFLRCYRPLYQGVAIASTHPSSPSVQPLSFVVTRLLEEIKIAGGEGGSAE